MIEKPGKLSMVVWVVGAVSFAGLCGWSAFREGATDAAEWGLLAGLYIALAAVRFVTWLDDVMIHRYSKLLNELISQASPK